MLISFGKKSMMGNIGYVQQTKLLVRKSVKIAQLKALAEEKSKSGDKEKGSVQMFYKNKLVVLGEETLGEFIERNCEEEIINRTIDFLFILM